MPDPLSCKVLEPDPSGANRYHAEINGRWIKADDRDHAKQIIEAARMCFLIGEQSARLSMRLALGLEAFGDHARQIEAT